VRGVHQVTAPASHETSPEPRRVSGWTELALLFALSAVIAAVVIIGSAPSSSMPGTTHNAVLVRGETTSLSCEEGVTRVGSTTWVNDNESLDRLRLPMHGRLHIVNNATAVFEARGLEVRLAPAMPCTAG
jgi:hypothetical protein